MLLSNRGRPLLEIVADTCGRHDTLGGACSAESNTVRYALDKRHMHNCRDSFLLALAREDVGLSKRDLPSNINFFMNVPVTPEGGLTLRGRHLRRWSVRRTAGADRCAGADLELPAAEQPVQRLQPDTGARPHADGRPPLMFSRVLIANRGAIACRILRTLRRMDIASVAIYSEADEHALHVRLADEACCVGPAPAAESYLRQERILEIAQARGAQAIHPGYGFLSENAAFAESCEAAGIAFIGPTPAQMRDFGLKHTARALAEANGLPLLPGSGLLPDVAAALREAERIGYPVMLKSTAGGGGIGMQQCGDGGGAAARLRLACSGSRRTISRTPECSSRSTCRTRVTSRCSCSATAAER